MGTRAKTPALRKLKQENYHNLAQWVTAQTSLEYSMWDTTSQTNQYTHKDKTQVRINKYYKFKWANQNIMCHLPSHISFQYPSYMAVPVWPSTEHHSVSLLVILSKWHCLSLHCSKPSESKSNSISLLPSTELRVSSFWMCGESLFFFSGSREPHPSGSFGSVSSFVLGVSLFSGLECF